MLLPKGVTYKNEFLAQSIMLEQALKFFIVFFVVVEPISLIPVFSGLTEGASDGYKHKMALKSVLVASGILLLFALVGAGFLVGDGHLDRLVQDFWRAVAFPHRARDGVCA